MEPKHIAIILDGNRRFSKKKGVASFRGHYKGAKKIDQLLNWALELGIKELTLYTFSLENFNRGKKEVDYLFDLFRKNIKNLKNDERIDKHKIRVRFIGRLRMFPKDLWEDMQELMKITRKYNGFKLNFAMAYGSKAEIVDMVSKIVKKKIKKIDEEVVRNNLYLKDSPDLLIRPGGEQRLSNFLLFQMAYTELYFIDRLWPQFSKKDFVNAIDGFKKRERRFGR